MLFVSCNLFGVKEEDSYPKQIKGISDYSKYEAIGVGQEKVKTKEIEIPIYRYTIVGLTNSIIEKVIFYDENLKPIQQDFHVTGWAETTNFLFFNIQFSNQNGVFRCCLYKSSGEVFMLNSIDWTAFNDMANDMKEDFGDILFLHNYKLQYQNGQLKIETYVSQEASNLFTFYTVDRYENVFSTADAEYKGKIVTKDGMLKSFSVNDYFRGRNGVVYFYSSQGRGYFNANGEMVYTSNTDFFPDTLFDYESTGERWYTPIIYKKGLDQYYIFKHTYGNAGFTTQIEHISFDEENPLEYSSETINIPTVSGWTDSNLIYYELLGQCLYVLRDSGFFRIDMTNATVKTLSNTYPKYVKCENVGEGTFRMTVIDETQSIVSIAIDSEGQITELSRDRASFDSIVLFPIATI